MGCADPPSTSVRQQATLTSPTLMLTCAHSGASSYSFRYVVHAHILNTPSVSRLLRNKGESNPGYFVDITESAGVRRDALVQDRAEYGGLAEVGLFGPATLDFGAAFADLDGDGLQDLLVNGDGMSTQIYWSNGVDKLSGNLTFNPCKPSSSYNGETPNPVFGECGYTPAEAPMGATLGDLDQDGQLDMFITSSGPRAPLSRHREHVGFVDSYIGNRLYFNLGKGKRAFGCKGPSCRDFAQTDKSQPMDDENDGGGGDDGGDDDSIWTEDGSLAAAQYWGTARGGWGWGTAMFDYDNDRDLDIAMTNGFSVPGDTACVR